MSDVRAERLTVQRDEGFVVFLIGARFNSLWQLPIALAVSRAMGRMLKELSEDPDSGLLSYEQQFGWRTTMLVQYWRSTDDLLRYSHAKGNQHVPAWRQWVKKWSDGAVGIFHETYTVEPGSYECLYHQMPPFGLGKVGPLIPAEGEYRTAAKRLRPKAPAIAA